WRIPACIERLLLRLASCRGGALIVWCPSCDRRCRREQTRSLAAPPQGTLEDSGAGRRPLMTSRAELSSERERAVPRPQINVPRLRVDDSQAEAREQRRKGYGYLV